MKMANEPLDTHPTPFIKYIRWEQHTIKLKGESKNDSQGICRPTSTIRNFIR